MDEVQVQVRFTKTADNGITYTDALYYSLDDYSKLSDKELEKAKQTRFDAWVELINTPPPPPEELPPEEEIAQINEELAELNRQINLLEEKKDSLEAVDKKVG